MIFLSLPDSTYLRKRRNVLSALPWCSPQDGTLRERRNCDTDLCVICLTRPVPNFRFLDPLSLRLLLAFCPACSLQCRCAEDGCQCLCGSWFGSHGHKKKQETLDNYIQLLWAAQEACKCMQSYQWHRIILRRFLVLLFSVTDGEICLDSLGRPSKPSARICSCSWLYLISTTCQSVLRNASRHLGMQFLACCL